MEYFERRKIMNSLEEKRKYLKSYSMIAYELDTNKEEIIELIKEIRGIKAMVYTDMPKANKKTDLSDRMIELENRRKILLDEKARLIKEKWTIIKSIDSIQNPLEKAFLRDVYINNISIPNIVEKRRYSAAQVNRYLKKAVTNYKIPKDDIE